MDHLRRYKKNNQHSRPSSVDGFIGGPKERQQGGFDFKRHSAYRPAQQRVDGLQKSERFMPRSMETRQVGQPLVRRQSVQRDGEGNIQLRTPAVSHKKHKKTRNRSWRRVALKSFLVLFIVGLLTAGYLFGKGYLKARQIFSGGGSAAALQENVDPSLLKGEGDGRVNILLLGGGGESYDGGSNLTDTIILASIDPIHREAALLSIPRDFYVQSEYGATRINAIYKYARAAALTKNPKDKKAANEAGMKAMDKVIEKTMGVPVHYHAVIDFEGFQDAINTVGGIDIDVKKPVYELMHVNGQPYVLDVKVGKQRFGGQRALMFARSRKTSLRGDFDRSERQRQMLVALKDKILSVGTLANPVKLNNLLDDFGDHMQANLTVDELMRIHEITSQIPSNSITSLSLVDEPNVLLGSANIGGSVQIPKAGTFSYKEIHKFVRNRLKDGFIRSENATIAVFNGTTIAGLASRTAEDLESYGYNISEVANSPIKNQQKTTIVDLRNGEKKYTKSYLEKRFGVTVVTSLPDNRITPGNADFVIILGQNEQNRLQN